MEQELLKKLEKSAENFDASSKKFDEKSEKIDSIEKTVNGLADKKSVEDLTGTVTVTKDELDKTVKAVDKLLGRQNEIQIASKESGMSFDQYFSDQLAIGFKENADALAKFTRKETKSFNFQMKTVGDMAFSTNFGTASQSVAMVRPGIIEGTSRKVHLRQLFPQGSMSGSTFYYVKESGTGEGTIGTVAEGSAKAQVDFDLAEASANAEYIAGYTVISKKMLADTNGMTSFLQSRLIERLLKAEDSQLLSGDGVTPNIGGVLKTGNYTAYSGSSANDIDEIIGGISQMEDSLERDANGILVRPATLYDMVRSKQSNAGYNLPMGVTVDPNGTPRILGVPVYASTAMTAGKFIVGDFRLGALLLMREPPVVEFFEQDSTNVRSNKITVRVEERIAFPIFGSDYFIYGDLSGS